MSDRLDYYFRQRVTEAELDLGFAELEQADRNQAADLGFTGVLANAVVSQHAPVADLTVDVSGPGAIIDQLGQRIFFSALQNVSVAQDDNGVSTGVAGAGREKVVSVFVKFDRALADPRVDGNSLTVFFRRDESFKFIVAQGAEAPAGAAIPPPLHSDAILLADITRTFGQTQVLAANVSTARRQDAFVLNGAPRSIRRGRALEAIADVLSFLNAHVNGVADRHPAAGVDYTGGANWADGTTNPPATVEAQLDKLVVDLSAATGAQKVGAAGTPGAPNSLAPGGVKSQLDALLAFLNAHLNQPLGAHAATAVSYAGGNSWKDGTANPPTSVEGQLDKVVNELAADAGAARLGVGARPAWLDGRANPAGVSILDALSKVVTDLNEQAAGTDGSRRIGAQASGNLPAGSVRTQLDALDATSVRTNVPNVFTAPQTVNGASGDTNAALVTTAGPALRKLLWEFAINGNYKGRLYSSIAFNGAVELTINARWDGANWVRDSAYFNPTMFAAKWTFHNYEWRIDVKTASAASFADSAWDGYFRVAFTSSAPRNITIDANGELTSSGPLTGYSATEGEWGGTNSNIGGGSSFASGCLPAVPSSVTFNVRASAGTSGSPSVYFADRMGVGWWCITTGALPGTRYMFLTFSAV